MYDKKIICDDQNVVFFSVCPNFQCHYTVTGFTHQSHPVHSAERWPMFSGLSLPRTAASVKTENMGEWLQPFNKIKSVRGLNLIHVSSLSVNEAFAHFYDVGCHGFQWDESRLRHVNLLFISNDPGKILWMEHRTCDLCQLWKTHMPFSTHQKSYENV